ncbi:MAG: penicillin-binding protein 2 [Sporomusaceae bacterium]|nr:penicillin-binding protein 2 [Sporomusaceae bacterium]
MAFSISRLRQLFILMSIGLLAICGRLFFLQIIETDKLSLSALESRIVEAPAHSLRGDILDRSGLPLTGTVGQSYLFVFPEQLEQPRRIADQLAAQGIVNEELMLALTTAKRPFRWRQAIDPQTAERINAAAIPGIIAVADKKRYSPGGLAAHVIGYINAADNRGVSGLEATYNTVLQGGQTASVAAMVDAAQRIIPGLGYKRIYNEGGQQAGSVVLTIDKRLQAVVEAVMDQAVSKGAVVIVDPASGEILAMASRPNFDADHLEQYLENDSAPLLNRAIMNYQPGSVFKLAVAAAVLEEKLARPDDQFFDAGYIDVNSIRFRGWDYDKGSRGRVSLTEAMAYSSNPVFIELGLKLGADKLITYARSFGFGRLSGSGLPGEAAGFLPSADAVFAADLANLSIGQGLLEASPLQIVTLVAAIANGGVWRQPVLVSRVINPDGSVTVVPQNQPPRQVMSPVVAAQLREMMKAVTAYGTGAAAQLDRFGAAGKTGSAETGRLSQGKSINHAWFAGFAPADKPQLAAVVFIEEGMSGGDIAAPLFREIMEQILQQEKPRR